MTATLTHLINKYSISGVVVTYGFANHPLQTVSAGLSDIQNHTAMNSQTLFIVGSITKSFVAAAILKLVEAKKIQINEALGSIAQRYGGEIAAYVTQYPDLKAVTVRELLNHTSGVPKDVNTPDFVKAFIAHPEKVWSDQDLLSIAMRHSFYFTPGEAGAWSYTNTDYLLLSIVLKSVTQESVPQIFFHLWQQAKLQDVYYADNGVIPAKALKSLATGYAPIDGGLAAAFKAFPMVSVPGKTEYKAYALKSGYNVFDPTSSGIITSTRSLAQWYRALFEGNFLKPTSIKMMLNGVSIAKDNDLKYGFGVATAVMPHYGYLVTHNGLGPGYSVVVLYFFKYHLVVAIATNTSNTTVNTFDIFSGKLLPGFVTDIMPILVGSKKC